MSTPRGFLDILRERAKQQHHERAVHAIAAALPSPRDAVAMALMQRAPKPRPRDQDPGFAKLLLRVLIPLPVDDIGLDTLDPEGGE